jgi:hypothetical protein
MRIRLNYFNLSFLSFGTFSRLWREKKYQKEQEIPDQQAPGVVGRTIFFDWTRPAGHMARFSFHGHETSVPVAWA